MKREVIFHQKQSRRPSPSRRDSGYGDLLGGIFLTAVFAAAVFVTGSALTLAARGISDAAETRGAERTERDYAAGLLWRGEEY
jgi:hypothetical protein